VEEPPDCNPGPSGFDARPVLQIRRRWAIGRPAVPKTAAPQGQRSSNLLSSASSAEVGKLVQPPGSNPGVSGFDSRLPHHNICPSALTGKAIRLKSGWIRVRIPGRVPPLSFCGNPVLLPGWYLCTFCSISLNSARTVEDVDYLLRPLPRRTGRTRR
jgi:hypothetical protein